MMGASDRERPGIMVYFEMLYTLEHLDDEEAGKLFKAALRYGSTGEVPEFEGNRVLEIAWQNMRAAIDRDGDRYEGKKQHSRYSRYCGVEKDAGRVPLDFEDWKERVDRNRRSSTVVNEADQHIAAPPSISIPTPAAISTTTPTTRDGGAGGDQSVSSRFIPSAPSPEAQFEDRRAASMAMLADYVRDMG